VVVKGQEGRQWTRHYFGLRWFLHKLNWTVSVIYLYI